MTNGPTTNLREFVDFDGTDEELAALILGTMAAQHAAAVEVDRRLAARGTYLPAPTRDTLLGTTAAWLARPGVQ